MLKTRKNAHVTDAKRQQIYWLEFYNKHQECLIFNSNPCTSFEKHFLIYVLSATGDCYSDFVRLTY